MSFWNQNPCVPGWTESLQAWWSELPPRLLEGNCILPTTHPIAGCQIRLATTEQECIAVSEFWSRYYANSTLYKCQVPSQYIFEAIHKRLWELWIVVHSQTKEILGTGVRRHIENLHIGAAVWKKAAMIDYFCVHPGWRAKGVGRWILTTLHNQGPRPLPPHLILWEGLRPSIPPLSVGWFWCKRKDLTLQTQGHPQAQLRAESVWKTVQKGEIWSEGPLREVSLWRVPCGETVAIWNTFHRTIQGAMIGILLGKPSQKAAEEMVAGGPFGIVLSPNKLDGWEMDSPYQWIAYNMVWGKLGKADFPCLAL